MHFAQLHLRFLQIATTTHHYDEERMHFTHRVLKNVGISMRGSFHLDPRTNINFQLTHIEYTGGWFKFTLVEVNVEGCFLVEGKERSPLRIRRARNRRQRIRKWRKNKEINETDNVSTEEGKEPVINEVVTHIQVESRIFRFSCLLNIDFHIFTC